MCWWCRGGARWRCRSGDVNACIVPLRATNVAVLSLAMDFEAELDFMIWTKISS